MPTWGEILVEIRKQQKQNPEAALDIVRRKYLVACATHTRRATILYATRWTQPLPHPLLGQLVSITDEDVQGMMEVIHGLPSAGLDLILHSPGGSIEAAEAVVGYLRSKFTNIRVIVPYAAMSAATMIACAANRVMMGKHSFLGPIDPQISLQTQLGYRMVPAQAVLDQFDRAKAECEDPRKMGAWVPMLSQYGPDLIQQCQNAIRLSKQLVTTWLREYMFRGSGSAGEKAGAIAEWLADHGHWMTHGRHIPRTELKKRGMTVEYLERDVTLQDLALSVFHATTQTFDNSPPTMKIIENHLGKAFIKHAGIVVQQRPSGPAEQVTGASLVD